LPGDFIGDLPVNSFIHPAGLPITTSSIEVLRRPPESALRAGIGVVDQRDSGALVTARERHAQDVEDEVGAHVRGELPADDPAAVGVDD
jgi:hypothetical protein